MQRLVKLVPKMVELVFNNVTFAGQRSEREDVSIQDVLHNILKAIGTKGSKMMKLKLSSINLNL